MHAAVAMGLLLAIGAAPPVLAESPWREVEPGIDRAHFAPDGTVTREGVITVIRIDPARWSLSAFSNLTGDSANNRSVREWCRTEGLVVAVNAGMFATDYVTHIGYLRCGDQVNNSHVNAYLSAAAFQPRHDGLPPFRIFDLDEVSFARVREDYACVVQNLRLIKRPGENRWPPQDKKWNEVALGEDEDGNILFIHVRQAYSMHDLNEILLSLPIGLVAAQHLEGGPEAQLVLRQGERGVEFVGSWESGFQSDRDRGTGWPVPNVLGVTRRAE
ncbi:MAG: hypothetical protein HKN12_10430 [Gemmatimonadetes bacterium]|nr:hypothetical protein [Gemmatimonadota bacterium]